MVSSDGFDVRSPTSPPDEAAARPTLDGDPITVRPYEAADRSADEHIGLVTGDVGDPVDWIRRDTESFADLWWMVPDLAVPA